MKALIRLLILISLFLTACDDKAKLTESKVTANWELVGMGQEKSVALHLLGEPDYTEQLVVLGLETERLTWKTYFPASKVYQLDFVLDRLVAKQAAK